VGVRDPGGVGGGVSPVEKQVQPSRHRGSTLPEPVIADDKDGRYLKALPLGPLLLPYGPVHPAVVEQALQTAADMEVISSSKEVGGGGVKGSRVKNIHQK